MSSPTRKPGTYKAPIALPPGNTILELLEDSGMTQVELSRRLGRRATLLNEIIHGKRPISFATALALEKVFDLPASFWLKLERNYQMTKARLAEEEKLQAQLLRAKQFPYGELSAIGFVPKTRKLLERAQNLLKFFRVASFEALDETIDSYSLVYRRSGKYEIKREKLAAWLRMGELAAGEYELQQFSGAKLRRSLPRIRQLTREPPSVFQPELKRLGESCGIAFIFVPEFTSFPVSGLVRWINKRPHVLVNLRYKTDDQMWWSLFHEIGHVLLSKRTRSVIVHLDARGAKAVRRSAKEHQADKFARDSLIPPDVYRKLRARRNPSRGFIMAKAEELEISPGILVGMLQHEELIAWKTVLNCLKRRFKWGKRTN